MELQIFVIGARAYDFTDDQGRRVVGAKLYCAAPADRPGDYGAVVSEMPIHPDHRDQVLAAAQRLSLTECNLKLGVQPSGKNLRTVCVGIEAA